MDFAAQIKKLRQEKNLTQEQFAARLQVSRQAVSNWENNRNLPDIGMLIALSETFDISLDTLLKGENNMKEKVIKDGSETRRAKYHMVSSIVGGLLLGLGVLLLVIKGLSVEYIDDMGVLHENFFLVPCGFLCIFTGLLTFLTLGVKTLVEKIRRK